ncbi:alpha/beta hydrolase [Meridianimarinicoccus sp. RP-17]|uniref:alpha/beta hydrolase n=1 Tax=Meridianimarinicoccus zhengii TaxID=2056810 RepID=UPI0013A70230|nr:alpha/beta fold hydrolase [Phycocomes zhengii]
MGRVHRITAPIRAVLLCAGLVVAGCAPRGSITVDPAAAGVGSVQQVLVATTRAPDPGSAVLSRDRSYDLGFLDMAVSVPPDRLPGTVRFPEDGAVDPARDFVTVSAHRLNGIAAFRAAVSARAATLPPDKREALVFVHGYNTNFAEGLYRQAQISHDFSSQGVSVNYAWSSAGDFRAYAFDRESALFARDGLEDLLDALARSDTRRIVAVAHSMGAQVLMDTLRQMAIRGAPEMFGQLSSVVLLAPDLDIDVFRTQAAALAGLDIPIYIFVSGQDRALRLSALLRGQSTRLGSMVDASALGDLVDQVPIRVIDVTEFDANDDPLQHNKAVSSPSMIALFDGLGASGLEMFRDAQNPGGLIENVQRATQEISVAVTGR